MNEYYSNAWGHSYIKPGCVNVFKGGRGRKKRRKDGKKEEREDGWKEGRKEGMTGE